MSIPAYSNPSGIPATRTKVLACATVIEEMQPLLPPDMPRQVLDFGLHLRPNQLTQTLQAAIDQSLEADLILLGYGLCSRAVVGLRANHCTLVVPRVDDCIAIFLGSRNAHRQQACQEPGTYYLTKGWIEVGDSPFSEYRRLVERYGEQRAERMTRLMLKHYTRLAFINTGQYEIERFRAYARQAAERFGLRFEEIAGAPSLVNKLLFGPWDDEIVVAGPGETITYEMFLNVSDNV
ncbi:MAG TPA: DUF1638 domain-containing protein [Anaerolineae bacterium]|nr:DUF1638 domain-containing protein [Anaerolineae bacterium]